MIALYNMFYVVIITIMSYYYNIDSKGFDINNVIEPIKSIIENIIELMYEIDCFNKINELVGYIVSISTINPELTIKLLTKIFDMLYKLYYTSFGKFTYVSDMEVKANCNRKINKIGYKICEHLHKLNSSQYVNYITHVFVSIYNTHMNTSEHTELLNNFEAYKVICDVVKTDKQKMIDMLNAKILKDTNIDIIKLGIEQSKVLINTPYESISNVVIPESSLKLSNESTYNNYDTVNIDGIITKLNNFINRYKVIKASRIIANLTKDSNYNDFIDITIKDNYKEPNSKYVSFKLADFFELINGLRHDSKLIEIIKSNEIYQKLSSLIDEKDIFMIKYTNYNVYSSICPKACCMYEAEDISDALNILYTNTLMLALTKNRVNTERQILLIKECIRVYENMFKTYFEDDTYYGCVDSIEIYGIVHDFVNADSFIEERTAMRFYKKYYLDSIINVIIITKFITEQGYKEIIPPTIVNYESTITHHIDSSILNNIVSSLKQIYEKVNSSNSNFNSNLDNFYNLNHISKIEFLSL